MDSAPLDSPMSCCWKGFKVVTEADWGWGLRSALRVVVIVGELNIVALGEDTASCKRDIICRLGHSELPKVFGSPGVGLPHLPLLIWEALPYVVVQAVIPPDPLLILGKVVMPLLGWFLEDSVVGVGM